MKVLILSWYFPPSNTIGAIRVGKLAKYLMRRNVDVRVVTAREPDLSKTLPLEIPADPEDSTSTDPRSMPTPDEPTAGA